MNTGVAVIIRNKQDQILVSLRGPQVRSEPYTWENVGGGVDEGEQPEEAIVREVKEEIGVELVNLRLLFENTSTASNGDSWKEFIYQGEILGEPSIQEPDKCLEHRWVTKEQLKELPLASFTKKDFENLGWL